MTKIVHIITSLSSGGAQNMLYKLLKHSNTKEYYHEVISLMDKGIYGEQIKSLGVKVHCLNLHKGRVVSSLIRTIQLTRDFDVVNTWLYHADLLGFVAGKIFNRKKLVWNIRHSNLDKDTNKARTLGIVKLNGYLSRFVDVVTYNSYRAKETHSTVGYRGHKIVMIPNGFELDRFYFDLESRVKVRKRLNVGEEPLIITVGRWDIQKDYYTLIRALDILRKQNTNFRMLMVGSQLDSTNEELVELVEKHGLESRILLLGRRNDVPALLSATDIYVSSSLGESFSNSIGEAMACELPCVVTDVGDSSLIVGDTGYVVKPESPEELGQVLHDLLANTPVRRRPDARNRIKSNYDISSVTKEFEKLWDEL